MKYDIICYQGREIYRPEIDPEFLPLTLERAIEAASRLMNHQELGLTHVLVVDENGHAVSYEGVLRAEDPAVDE